MPDNELTTAEWDRIRDVVEDKLDAVRSGFYGRDRTTREWIDHLEDILERLPARNLDESDWEEIYYALESREEDSTLLDKIGPDGSNMAVV